MASTAWPDLWDIALFERRPAEARATLFRLQAQLFVDAPSRDTAMIRAFEAIARGFLPIVDPATLAAAAEILAPCPDTPAAVLSFLAARGAPTSAIVAARAPALPQEVADILLATAPGRLLLAARADLDPTLVGRLLATQEPALDRALARNAALPAAWLAPLHRRAARDGDLAGDLLARPDLTLDEEAALYCAADGPRRAAIRQRLSASARHQRPHLPLRADGAETGRLVSLAAAGDVPSFEAELTRLLGLPEGTAWAVLAPGRAELLGLALKALAVSEDDGILIGLTLHPALSHSVEAIGALAATLRATPRVVAVALVEAIVGARIGRQPSGTHERVMDPAERPAARLPAQAPGLRREGERRAAG